MDLENHYQTVEQLYSLLSFYDQLSDIPVQNGYVIHPTNKTPVPCLASAKVPRKYTRFSGKLAVQK